MRSVAEQADGNFVGMWRQLTDLLAQNPRDTDPEMVALGLIQVHQLSSRLDDAERVEGVRALARRIHSELGITAVVPKMGEIVRL